MQSKCSQNIVKIQSLLAVLIDCKVFSLVFCHFAKFLTTLRLSFRQAFVQHFLLGTLGGSWLVCVKKNNADPISLSTKNKHLFYVIDLLVKILRQAQRASD